jgi:surfactin synthase thioesterase subunit
MFREVFHPDLNFDTHVVKYPGKGTEMASWAGSTSTRLASLAGGRAPVLLGASLGAMAALETAQYFEDQRWPLAGVVVLSSVAPQWRAPAAKRPWSDAALLDFIRFSNEELPESFESPAVRDYALGVLRRDLEWADEYRGPRSRPLSCPMSVFRAEYDPLVPLREGTSEWAMWTTGEFTAHLVSGGSHLFFTWPGDAAAVRDVLSSLVPSTM